MEHALDLPLRLGRLRKETDYSTRGLAVNMAGCLSLVYLPTVSNHIAQLCFEEFECSLQYPYQSPSKIHARLKVSPRPQWSHLERRQGSEGS